MNTQTHMIMGAVIFGKPLPRLAWFGVAGGILPDLPMFIIVAGLRAQGVSLEKIFGEYYWQPWWQIANAIGHNFWLWSLLAVISGISLLRRKSASQTYNSGNVPAMIFALSGSAFIHSMIDFACHRDDAHMQFWPLSDWRFRSPISYWDPAHYGTYFSFFEAGLGLLMALVLFRRYKTVGIRMILAIAIFAYVAVPAFYFWSISNHDHASQFQQG
jgi:hypothetical protein